MSSRTFNKLFPKKPHLVRGRGTSGEVRDVREDVDEALDRLESESVIDLQFYFDGSLVNPTAGDHEGQYGICHTAGPGRPAGSIWYDDGLTVADVTKKGLVVSPRVDVAGTVTMDANGIYQALSATAPYSWTAKGGGGGVPPTVPLRLSTLDRLALSPSDGTLVYDLDERKLYIYQFDIDWPTWSEV